MKTTPVPEMDYSTDEWVVELRASGHAYTPYSKYIWKSFLCEKCIAAMNALFFHIRVYTPSLRLRLMWDFTNLIYLDLAK